MVSLNSNHVEREQKSVHVCELRVDRDTYMSTLQHKVMCRWRGVGTSCNPVKFETAYVNFLCSIFLSPSTVGEYLGKAV